MLEIIHRKKRLSSFKLIALGFAGVIVLGALILMLPFSSNTGSVTPFHEALFTSTSAVCVTGLVVQDTGSYWSAFGQAVILLLIQIGGLGVDAFGFFGDSKSFIITTGIIHRNALLSVDRYAARPLLSTRMGSNGVLAGMFSFDEDNIQLRHDLFNKQKNPGDKFFITGMGDVQFFIIPLRLMQACPSASVAGRPPHCRGAPAPASAP